MFSPRFIRVSCGGFKFYGTLRVDIAFAAGWRSAGVPFEVELFTKNTTNSALIAGMLRGVITGFK